MQIYIWPNQIHCFLLRRTGWCLRIVEALPYSIYVCVRVNQFKSLFIIKKKKNKKERKFVMYLCTHILYECVVYYMAHAETKTAYHNMSIDVCMCMCVCIAGERFTR